MQLRSDHDAVSVENMARKFTGRKARIAQAIMSLYRGENPEAVAAKAGVMTGTVRRWGDAFNNGGLAEAFEVSSGGVYDLREDYDAQTVRRAADETVYDAQKARLLAVASMYDGVATKEIVRMSGVSASRLSQWRDDFNRNGLHVSAPASDTHLQANFRAANRYYPLHRVVEYRKRALTPDVQHRLDAIVMSYNERTVEVIADAKGVSRALVAAWIKAFNAGGPKALEGDKPGLASKPIAQANLELPEGYDSESLRTAARASASIRQKNALFALATLYETRSVRSTKLTHNVSTTQLGTWRKTLADGGPEAFLPKAARKPVLWPSDDEFDAAVMSAETRYERDLITAARSVRDGTPVAKAAEDIASAIKPLRTLTDALSSTGIEAFRHAKLKLDIPFDAATLRDIAQDYHAAGRGVLFALASIADGAGIDDVITEEVTLLDLRKMATRLTNLGEHAADIRRVPTTVRKEDPVNPIVRWKTNARSPFILKVRALVIHSLRGRPDREAAVAKANLPLSVLDEWAEAAKSGGVAFLATLDGRRGKEEGSERWLAALVAIDPRSIPPEPRLIRMGLIAYFEGASERAAGQIAGRHPEVFLGDVRTFRESGFAAIITPVPKIIPVLVSPLQSQRAKAFNSIDVARKWNTKDNVFLGKVKRVLVEFLEKGSNAEEVLKGTEFRTRNLYAWTALFRAGGTGALAKLAEPRAETRKDISAYSILRASPSLTPTRRKHAVGIALIVEGASLVTAAAISGVISEDLEVTLGKFNVYGMLGLSGFERPKVEREGPYERRTRSRNHRPASGTEASPTTKADAPPVASTIDGAANPTNTERLIARIDSRLVEKIGPCGRTILKTVRNILRGSSVSYEADIAKLPSAVVLSWMKAFKAGGVQAIEAIDTEVAHTVETIAHVAPHRLESIARICDGPTTVELNAFLHVRRSMRVEDAAVVTGIHPSVIRELLKHVSRNRTSGDSIDLSVSAIACCATEFPTDTVLLDGIAALAKKAASAFRRTMFDAVLRKFRYGENDEQIAEAVGVSAELVVKWTAMFRDGGLDGLVRQAERFVLLPPIPRNVDLLALSKLPSPDVESRLLRALAALYDGADMEEAAVMVGFDVSVLEKLKPEVTHGFIQSLVSDKWFRLAVLAGISIKPIRRKRWLRDAEKGVPGDKPGPAGSASSERNEESRLAKRLEAQARVAEKEKLAEAKREIRADKSRREKAWKATQAAQSRRKHEEIVSRRERKKAEIENARSIAKAERDRKNNERDIARIEMAEQRRKNAIAKAVAMEEEARQLRADAEQQYIAMRAAKIEAERQSAENRRNAFMEAAKKAEFAEIRDRMALRKAARAASRMEASRLEESVERERLAAATLEKEKAERHLRVSAGVERVRPARRNAAAERAAFDIAEITRKSEEQRAADMRAVASKAEERAALLAGQSDKRKSVHKSNASKGGIAMREDYDVTRISALGASASRPATKLKYKVLLLAYQGNQYLQIADKSGVSPQLSKLWIDEFNRGGIGGLMQARSR